MVDKLRKLLNHLEAHGHLTYNPQEIDLDGILDKFQGDVSDSPDPYKDLEYINAKVVFFKSTTDDPIFGSSVPNPDTLSDWLIEGMERNTELSGFVLTDPKGANAWLNPFNDAHYCEQCGTVKPKNEIAHDKDGCTVEFSDNTICKKCLEQIRTDDPELYKDIMEIE